MSTKACSKEYKYTDFLKMWIEGKAPLKVVEVCSPFKKGDEDWLRVEEIVYSENDKKRVQVGSGLCPEIILKDGK